MSKNSFLGIYLCSLTRKIHRHDYLTALNIYLFLVSPGFGGTLIPICKQNILNCFRTGFIKRSIVNYEIHIKSSHMLVLGFRDNHDGHPPPDKDETFMEVL